MYIVASISCEDLLTWHKCDQQLGFSYMWTYSQHRLGGPQASNLLTIRGTPANISEADGHSDYESLSLSVTPWRALHKTKYKQASLVLFSKVTEQLSGRFCYGYHSCKLTSGCINPSFEPYFWMSSGSFGSICSVSKSASLLWLGDDLFETGEESTKFIDYIIIY